MSFRPNHRWLGRRAFSVSEMMIALSMLGLVMTAVYTSSGTLIGSMTASENYSVGQLQAMDYLSLDLRRATSASFLTGGTLTLQSENDTLTLTLPQYYDASDGKTPTAPKRTKVITANVHDKKKHKVFRARYYYHYGTLGGTVQVQYYLSNNVPGNCSQSKPCSLYRKVGTAIEREVGTGIQVVTFGPSAAAIEIDPVVTATMTFWPTRRAKQPPQPLSSTTFMREYYYADYKN